MPVTLGFVAVLLLVFMAVLYVPKRFFPERFAFWQAGARVKSFGDIYKKVSSQITDSLGRTLLFESIRKKSYFRIKLYFATWANASQEAKLVVTMDVAGVPKVEEHRYHMLQYAILGGVKNFERAFSFLVDKTDSIDDLILAHDLLSEMNRLDLTDEELVESYQLCLSLVEHRLSLIQPRRVSATVTPMPQSK